VLIAVHVTCDIIFLRHVFDVFAKIQYKYFAELFELIDAVRQRT